MAATMIGSAFLSATVQTLVEKLASKEFLDYFKKTKFDDSLLKDDKDKVMNMLLSQSSTSHNNMGVVAIVGMGGVRKTTLAQLAYIDEKVEHHFDLKAWACVSEDFDVFRVTKALLESVTSKTWEIGNLDLLRL
ncbi:hypothetical protein KIW84_055899 [Lathyrus oleraceus]|uniref:NB-ARC domain-containing protein n=1 Tax=Pisum sativum TaxID=3888 RepID=A0A9D4WWT8_PEA|nr:hypothetical protein KIW84_055899 [Pisum sativum]